MDKSIARAALMLAVPIAACTSATRKHSPLDQGTQPVKIEDLGQLDRSQIPVTRRARSWYTKVLQDHLTKVIDFDLCFREANSTAVIGTFNERPKHLAATADGNGVYFAVTDGTDRLYHATNTATVTEIRFPNSEPRDVRATSTDKGLWAITTENGHTHLWKLVGQEMQSQGSVQRLFQGEIVRFWVDDTVVHFVLDTGNAVRNHELYYWLL